jgi:hypothetical protein
MDERQRAIELVDYWTPFLVRLLVDAGVVAAFGRAERSAADVARQTHTHAPTVARIVRALLSRGVFEPTGDDRYRLTALGRRFLADEPQNVFGLAPFKPWELHAWAESRHTLHTGEAAFPAHYGAGYFDWLAEHPPLAAAFNENMRLRTTNLLDAAMPYFDWPSSGTAVDIGGGNGLLLERVLELRPQLRGVVFDLHHVVAEVPPRPDGRLETAGGDFFTDELPAGHELYLLSSVLHDWDDADARRILENCRRAMAPAARLVLFEAVTGASGDSLGPLDLHMLVLFGAQERSAEQWHSLLDSAGFTIERLIPTPGLAWIEARCSPASPVSR